MMCVTTLAHSLLSSLARRGTSGCGALVWEAPVLLPVSMLWMQIPVHLAR
jgi:hypothetical protein